jgi:radical SAM protein with 4Fe4S-binding SPASM domain
LFAGLITQRDLDEGTLARCVLEREDVHCEYAPRSAFIDPAGDVYPCYYCYASNEDFERYRGLRDEYRMGNVLEPSIREVWTSPRYRAFLARVKPIRSGDKLLHAVCAQCVMCLGFAERQAKKTVPADR